MIKKGRSLRKESYLCERSAVSIFWLRRNELLKVTVRTRIFESILQILSNKRQKFNRTCKRLSNLRKVQTSETEHVNI